MSSLPAEKEERLFTYKDYVEWDLKEGERYELIHGVAYAMSSPNERHQAVLGAMFYQFYNLLLSNPCKVYPAPFDVRLFYEEDSSDDTVVQPDIIVICGKEKIGPEGCRGAPDLVIEILSPSNSAIEMEKKLQLYQEAGVREYWVVNPVHNGLAAYLFSNGAMSITQYKSKGKVPVAVLDGLEINLDQVFAE